MDTTAAVYGESTATDRGARPGISDPDYQREEIEADGLAILMVLDLRSKRSEHNDQTLALDGARLFFALQAEIERLVLGERFASALRVDIEPDSPAGRGPGVGHAARASQRREERR